MEFFCVCCTQGIEIEGELPEKVASYEGVYYNYFSIGTLSIHPQCCIGA
jgi:hypothetical protein